MKSVQLPDNSLARARAMTIGVVTAGIAFVMELVLLPLILNELKTTLELSVVALSWVFNGYAIAVALAVLCGGFLGDMLDKRNLFLFGVALFAVGSLFSAQSNGIETLVLSRVLQGLGGGLYFPLVPVLLTTVNAQSAGRTLMIWGGLTGVAAALLPILGAALLAGFGWTSVFVAFAVVSSVAFCFVAIGETSDDGESLGRPNYQRLFVIRGYWLLLFYIFLTYGCFSFYLFHVTITWHANGFAELSVSAFQVCVWIAFSTASFILRDRVEDKGLNRSLVAAPVLIGLSFLMASIDSDNAFFQVLSATTIGVGLGCCNSPSTHLLLRMSPKGLRAMSASLDIIFARCGSVATIALLVVLGPVWVLAAVLGMMGVATLVAFAFLTAPPTRD